MTSQRPPLPPFTAATAAGADVGREVGKLIVGHGGYVQVCVSAPGQT